MGKRLDRAICFAVEKHAGMYRKGRRVPYIVHPMETLSIAATMTEEEEILCAAVLHDVVEDAGVTVEELRGQFGERVAGIVADESEDKRRDLPSGDTWKIRKTEALAHLSRAGRDSLIVALSDKLSNVRDTYREYCRVGEEVWERFNCTDPEEHAWYYRSVAELTRELSDTCAWQEYNDLVKRIFPT
jgi:guanosine-3',5'-bis(diphosphate) 3'-pyrophosphohydrolase